jgi:predicted MFS family arabinose efflux permease
MAFGSTFGAILEPFIGWRGVFLLVSAAGAGAFLLLLSYRVLLGDGLQSASTGTGGHPLGALRALFVGYAHLLGTARARRTYGYVFLNALFHSGVFTWLGLYFQRRNWLGEVGIGIALLGYGVPGLVLGPVIGRSADRTGRGRLIPLALAIAALAAGTLIAELPIVVAGVAATVLSLGYDMTQPLLAGIVTSIGGKRPGQAMGLNVFALFTAFGLGSLLFGAALGLGFAATLAIFAAVQLAGAVVAVPLFRSEVSDPTNAP